MALGTNRHIHGKPNQFVPPEQKKSNLTYPADSIRRGGKANLQQLRQLGPRNERPAASRANEHPPALRHCHAAPAQQIQHCRPTGAEVCPASNYGNVVPNPAGPVKECKFSPRSCHQFTKKQQYLRPFSLFLFCFLAHKTSSSSKAP